MFTDTEVGLAMGYGRNMARAIENAQVLIDGKNEDIAMLQAALRKARAELSDERAKRIAAEIRIEELLDMPIG